ncbi:MAG: GTPase Era [Alphaproteobacteria bacterium CG_4_10_14_0_2_um_filter_63_37]|nr:MAG: GTPase Era [Alphaproteobacteria bacterium CG_4_10_14_0_2_um_filter_63_37]
MNTPNPDFRAGAIALLGRPNAGKSTLLNRLVGQKIAITTPKPQTTRNRITGVVHREGGQLVLVDTPGLHKAQSRLHRMMVATAMRAAEEVDLVAFLVDVAQGVSEYDKVLLDRLTKGGRPLTILLNKVDRVAKPKLLPLLLELGKRYPQATLYPLSALKGDGAEGLVDLWISALPKSPPIFPEDQITDVTLRFLVSEIVREKLFLILQEELPYSVAVEVEKFSEGAERTEISATIWVAKDNHKGMVIGKGGAVLKDVGAKARADIEELLERPVFLELWVKVHAGWDERGHLLAQLGFMDGA